MPVEDAVLASCGLVMSGFVAGLSGVGVEEQGGKSGAALEKGWVAGSKGVMTLSLTGEQEGKFGSALVERGEVRLPCGVKTDGSITELGRSEAA